ncbi:unnamed protein product [Urochloa decumbens]|uniref:Uncharacterized protein n=1 Tax=Urochloa decumbens TaxID=240449 RepID=A0ABC9AIN8_9POAL
MHVSAAILHAAAGRRSDVLFAEAGKEVVDFLFSLVATAIKLVGKDAMVGSVGNLYASVDKLESTYVQPGAAKDALLRPPVAASPAASTIASSSLLRLPEPPLSGQEQPNTLYRCTNTYNISCRSYLAATYGKPCPSCNYAMATAANYLPPPGSSSGGSGQAVAAKGFVQGIVTYTVTDDLTVTPMSAISGITLLNTFGVRDLADLHEKTVQLGNDEGLAILKASLESKTVLTDVFLGNKQQETAGAGHV